ncbi:OLC1v1023574C1 [Oldenlandia corymbosa var. corymbosa]|uniref:OLC1v1023574C1 n=1 Tax=Oldenlandia corymbosa var. corymbosa TaxID=529605 RepID=A0AAV1C1N6_OLDCO|nr:OLC1v1023574C1 [Oldenlandia corymbosa var. corymbosa]
MKSRNQSSSLLLWAALTALISQNLLVPVFSAQATFEDQKNYYPRDPGAGTPPTPSGSTGGSPPRSSGGGGHGHGGTPPANCGNPPSGGHSTPTPSTPSGGGGYHHYSPPSTTPTTPTTPTPTTPIVPSPFFTPPTPSTPIDPGTGTPSSPGITIPSPPFPFDPNSPPFTCDFWRNHPTLIWGVLGWFGTVGGTLGGTSSGIPGFGSNMSLLQALGNTRSDGYGALYREGTAAYLNAMVNRGRGFPYTTNQVRDRFASSLRSNKAAANQARLFKLANEGRVKI